MTIKLHKYVQYLQYAIYNDVIVVQCFIHITQLVNLGIESNTLAFVVRNIYKIYELIWTSKLQLLA